MIVGVRKFTFWPEFRYFEAKGTAPGARGPGPEAQRPAPGTQGPGPGAFKSKTEVLKLKKLPNGGFETPRCALWLGIWKGFGSKLEYHRLPLEYHKAPGPGQKA